MFVETTLSRHSTPVPQAEPAHRLSVALAYCLTVSGRLLGRMILDSDQFDLAQPRHRFNRDYRSSMSITEVKKSVSEMSMDERLEVAAFIAHLNRSEDAAYRSELDRRMIAMDDGNKTSANSLQGLHDELIRRGR